MKAQQTQHTKALWRRLVLALCLAAITAFVVWPAAAQAQAFQPVPIGAPRIDLQAVEQSLWATKGAHPKDFNGWMQKFEDEVNAIYFATLRRQSPKADPATLMPRPVRVDAQQQNGLMYLYGYIDQNGKNGFQNGQDMLLFVFEQTKKYDPQQRKIYYGLRDGGGYYYRQPDTVYDVSPTGYMFFTGFFLYPTIWFVPHWRTSFVWWGTPYWSTGAFYARYNYFYGRYPRYYSAYRRTYYQRFRPWGWGRGAFFRRGAGGRYYYRPGYYHTYRGGFRRGYYRGYNRGFRRGVHRQRQYRQRRMRRQRIRRSRPNRGFRRGGGGGGRRRR